jgi:uncharacterized protein (DUF433 family)
VLESARARKLVGLVYDCCMVTKLGPRIVSDPGIQSGKPVVEGTRVDVATILRHLAAGWELDVVMREFGLSRDDVLAAVSYSAAVVDEHPKRGLER